MAVSSLLHSFVSGSKGQIVARLQELAVVVDFLNKSKLVVFVTHKFFDLSQATLSLNILAFYVNSQSVKFDRVGLVFLLSISCFLELNLELGQLS